MSSGESKDFYLLFLRFRIKMSTTKTFDLAEEKRETSPSIRRREETTNFPPGFQSVVPISSLFASIAMTNPSVFTKATSATLTDTPLSGNFQSLLSAPVMSPVIAKQTSVVEPPISPLQDALMGRASPSSASSAPSSPETVRSAHSPVPAPATSSPLVSETSRVLQVPLPDSSSGPSGMPNTVKTSRIGSSFFPNLSSAPNSAPVFSQRKKSNWSGSLFPPGTTAKSPFALNRFIKNLKKRQAQESSSLDEEQGSVAPANVPLGEGGEEAREAPAASVTTRPEASFEAAQDSSSSSSALPPIEAAPSVDEKVGASLGASFSFSGPTIVSETLSSRDTRSGISAPVTPKTSTLGLSTAIQDASNAELPAHQEKQKSRRKKRPSRSRKSKVTNTDSDISLARDGEGTHTSTDTDKNEIRDAASSSPFEGVSPIGAVAMESPVAEPAGGVPSDAVATEPSLASSVQEEAKHPGAVMETASSTPRFGLMNRPLSVLSGLFSVRTSKKEDKLSKSARRNLLVFDRHDETSKATNDSQDDSSSSDSGAKSTKKHRKLSKPSVSKVKGSKLVNQDAIYKFKSNTAY